MATIKVAGKSIEVANDLARAAGYEVATDGSTRELSFRADAGALIMEAMALGLSGELAVMRAVALHNERREAAIARDAEMRAADAKIHAARIQRQAAVLACRAAGKSEVID